MLMEYWGESNINRIVILIKCVAEYGVFPQHLTIKISEELHYILSKQKINQNTFKMFRKLRKQFYDFFIYFLNLEHLFL